MSSILFSRAGLSHRHTAGVREAELQRGRSREQKGGGEAHAEAREGGRVYCIRCRFLYSHAVSPPPEGFCGDRLRARCR